MLSCVLLAVFLYTGSPDAAVAASLLTRAIANTLTLVKLQLLTCSAVTAGVLALARWRPQVRRHLVVGSPSAICATTFRASLPIMLEIVFHQTIPLWQYVVGYPEADSLLMRLDTLLFAGVNPTLWLERLIDKPLTLYLWGVYLAWFIVFQGSLFALALLRPPHEWRDLVLATVMTLTLGYIGYILVPAVGPIYAMKAGFSQDLQGNLIGHVTGDIVDRFGVWRDAFPSIHAAIAMLLMLYTWRYWRRWSVPFTVFGISILLSTVYLRWHYVVDVVAGIALSVACSWLSPRLLQLWESRAAGHSLLSTEYAD